MKENPPNMIRGALFRGPGKDNRLYTFGGSTFLANKTDPSWQAPSSDEYSMWSYDTAAMTWGQFDITKAIPRRPNRGAWTEAVNIGVAFYLNGQVDRGSSYVMYTVTEYVGGRVSNATSDETELLGGMAIVDLNTRTVRNVSTDTLGSPRIGGGLLHTTAFGKTSNGTVVAFGGMGSTYDGTDTFNTGTMV